MFSPKFLKSTKIDSFLVVALLFGALFSLYGINWGWVEHWNPDQMAFKNLFVEGKAPLNPGWFDKPPFHTYFNFFLSTAPIRVLEKVFSLSSGSLRSLELIWSGILTIFLFLGSITLVFYITKRFFTLFAARIITLIYSTSAGFIAFNHFLTVDTPVTFWMLLSFYFSQNVLLKGRLSDYIFAGFFAGIAAATKYNGVAIAIAIVLAHCLSLNFKQWKKAVFSTKLLLGLLSVIGGFVVGNPFAVLDYRTFLSDFLYNYAVTPVYEGESGHGYWQFILSVQEVVGLPAFVIFSVATIAALLLWRTETSPIARKGSLILFILCLIYYYKMGSFPRVPARFVLPIVPFLLILSGSIWSKLQSRRILVLSIIAILIGYNTICSYYVGKRFVDDPRTVAQMWVKSEVPQGSTIESSKYSPSWDLLPGVTLTDVRMPFISGRGRLFKKLFNNNQAIVAKTQQDEQENEKWYAPDQLIKRNPDYVSINSRYYERFLEEPFSSFYPSVKQFFVDLLNEKYPYQIVFDRSNQDPPKWIYPQEIDFIRNRITLFKKRNFN